MQVRGASAQVIPASAKPIIIPPQKEVAPSIICDEKLEVGGKCGVVVIIFGRILVMAGRLRGVEWLSGGVA